MKDRNRNEMTTHGTFTVLDGERYYRIAAYDRIPPFLMSIASDTDLWMFVSSAGGLTAGRVDADGSLLPYETVDRLHDGHHHTGPITLLRVRCDGDDEVVWQPFSTAARDAFRIDRNLYKNAIGNRVVFEEINHDLDMTFRYRWTGSDEFGFVRTSTLVNHGSGTRRVNVLDGLRNILPYGASLALYQQLSCLVDAYKRADCDERTHLGVFSLTSRIIDRPEAAECLRANTVWCHGLPALRVSLSVDDMESFRRGDAIDVDRVHKGRRGDYLALGLLDLAADAEHRWHLVADVGRSHAQIEDLRRQILADDGIGTALDASLSTASENLIRNVGSADGIQLTANPETDVHHFANVLFNNMRGGVFISDPDLPGEDVADFIRTRNRLVAKRQASFVESLPARISYEQLLATADATGDEDLKRLAREYLPLYFGRRHGDPSRPWNRFTIRVRDADGTAALHYEGNWRDIFQNWEALGISFPAFLPGIIARFVNASTVDGFNPYRIMREGIDWEVVDPDDPWSYIGYWGDHQIIYLLKFLEAVRRNAPGRLEGLLRRELYCYADVPYRLRPYEDIVDDPHDTILYDAELAGRIAVRVAAMGADGKLLPARDGSVYHVNLLEKLVVPALSKLSNLVGDAGIWMNTQRPEWNDANNALVGYGVSMVTLCYLRRYLDFLETLLTGGSEEPVSMSGDVATWLKEISQILERHRSMLTSDSMPPRDRKQLLDELGGAFTAYRQSVYEKGFLDKRQVPVEEIVAFCRSALEYLDHAIRANRREDGLYHSYNLLEFTRESDGVNVHSLYEMLEGQVAALSSGAVSPGEAVDLVGRLFDSELYRKDHRSFLLYPERALPAFVDKNVIPTERARSISLLNALLDNGDRAVVERDASGVYRFHPDFRNARDLNAALDRIASRTDWKEKVDQDRQAVLDLFEDVFCHRAFTGRSGTMYGYEGLGCIYWHMVAKLLVAVQEVAVRAERDAEPLAVRQALIGAYYRIRNGLGFEKTPTEYGAFPTDPYSHTPPHGGARQPGMTGQVKEEILTRYGELGVTVQDGVLSFEPFMLRETEFLSEASSFHSYEADGRRIALDVPAGALAFTLCQVPIVYQRTSVEAWIRINKRDAAGDKRPGNRLEPGETRSIFERRGDITRIDVGIPDHMLYRP